MEKKHASKTSKREEHKQTLQHSFPPSSHSCCKPLPEQLWFILCLSSLLFSVFSSSYSFLLWCSCFSWLECDELDDSSQHCLLAENSNRLCTCDGEKKKRKRGENRVAVEERVRGVQGRERVCLRTSVPTICCLQSLVTQCLGLDGLTVAAPVLPDCSFFNGDTQQWETEGCVRTEVNLTHVQCDCTHFTLFGITAPKHNKIVPSAILELTPANVAASPTGLVTVMLVLCIFALMFAGAKWRDRQEIMKYDQLRVSKREKWKVFAAKNKRASFFKQVKRDGEEGLSFV